MLKSLQSSGSTFDSSKTLLWKWLQANANVVKTLATKVLSSYTGKIFICGWAISLQTSNQIFNFHILLDEYFPYSPIRIAYKDTDNFLKWPHVEPNGLLCLPLLNTIEIEANIHQCLLNAIELIERCQNDENYIKEEFSKEFLSYWDHSNKSIAIKSLLNINNRTARLTYIWTSKKYQLVGENIEQIESWLKNENIYFDISDIKVGVFGFLSTPPTPPFPKNPRALLKLLRNTSNEIIRVLSNIPFNEKALIVLGAQSPNGIGLIATELSAQSLNGFRRKKVYNQRINLLLRRKRGMLKNKDVQRLDAQWVHGRDQNGSLVYLENAKVLILGCGSLGSQVAMRLAQSGIGNLILIDPEILVPSNIGRHALGINSTNKYKSDELKLEIGKKYPHLKVESYPKTWQQVFKEHSNIINDNNLIISCMGEWSAEGQLSDWQDSYSLPQPIIYGWLDENGVASHAVAILDQEISLKCILDENGILKNPETKWDQGGYMQTEPACGTLFQPYGPLDASRAEFIVTRLSIDFLTHKVKNSVHRVYAGPTSQIKEHHGEWSQEHLKYRPNGFNGAFEYEKTALFNCNICNQCKKKK
ncbi:MULTISPECIES: ThiF family adenylyltransferase [Acinetobacter]|uniref:THIF-type NAD/FAD binding fold domain-containing protein n=1 Tax=Acinetobacter gyllenbergii CIP 110306 = MTCC 11365 TaxID=1217657 RepID=A0A829HKA3_9GAMM|nr:MULTISPECIES: ThiF family adenylyltransferase [Acinetobacter]EPF90585.1 hypothetical protein F957_00940 [Acinetobacter gyllenbergii CIP 110306 = MTCC 11365]EPH33895.1 hypothetical protein L293_3664 [Acinetobacter gyllenbergii CIP 110306 = MTCC 11365]MCU4377182.1 ThiF family adenylyltransferase [Acinetobacter haemolyticus]MEB3792767.1 ThiF family adenylyltransferase [Acinetobacter sp. IK40]NNP69004.1 hypothetical protein [Acinetobacter sp. Ac_5812]